MQQYQKKSRDEINDAKQKFQQAMIEDSVRAFRPRIESLDFDWTVLTSKHRTFGDAASKTFNWIPETETQNFLLIFRVESRPVAEKKLF